jgi:uncharacterized membrane protein (DUF2068 family)
MARPRHLTIIVALAFVQGFMVTLVALIWFGIASLFSPDSGMTSPLLVMMAEAKGGLLVVLALLYLVFVVGAWRMRDWARWVGLLASVLSILYVVRVLLGGGSIVVGLFVLIIPLTIIWYLLSPMGRQAFVR